VPDLLSDRVLSGLASLSGETRKEIQGLRVGSLGIVSTFHGQTVHIEHGSPAVYFRFRVVRFNHYSSVVTLASAKWKSGSMLLLLYLKV